MNDIYNKNPAPPFDNFECFKGKIILTSHGLNSNKGAKLIANQLQGYDLTSKHILLVIPTKYQSFGIDIIVIKHCEKMGFKHENIYLSTQALPEKVDYIYVTEGNTFEILHHLRERIILQTHENLTTYIRRNVASGSFYIGASAGAILAGVDVKLALNFDKNLYNTTDFTALGLFSGTIIPHYTSIELLNFIINSTEDELAPYDTIYNVDNDSVLCL